MSNTFGPYFVFNYSENGQAIPDRRCETTVLHLMAEFAAGRVSRFSFSTSNVFSILRALVHEGKVNHENLCSELDGNPTDIRMYRDGGCDPEVKGFCDFELNTIVRHF